METIESIVFKTTQDGTRNDQTTETGSEFRTCQNISASFGTSGEFWCVGVSGVWWGVECLGEFLSVWQCLGELKERLRNHICVFVSEFHNWPYRHDITLL